MQLGHSSPSLDVMPAPIIGYLPKFLRTRGMIFTWILVPVLVMTVLYIENRRNCVLYSSCFAIVILTSFKTLYPKAQYT